MFVIKSLRSSVVISVFLIMGISLLGCATSSQLKALEVKTDEALKKAQAANDTVQAMKAESRATGEAQRAAILASKAKECAERAERAAIRAETSAQAIKAESRATGESQKTAILASKAKECAQRAERAALRAETLAKRLEGLNMKSQ